MPSKEDEDPWWLSPSIFQIMMTKKATDHANLKNFLLAKISHALASARFATRPKRARKNWVENVCVDGVTYQLNCFVDEKTKMIVISDIRAPKTMRRTHRHT